MIRCLRIVFAFTIPLFLASCDDKPSVPEVKVQKSAFGLYKTESETPYWLMALEDGTYLLCRTESCADGRKMKLTDFSTIDLDGLDLQQNSDGGDGVLVQEAGEVGPEKISLAECEAGQCIELGFRSGGVVFKLVRSF